MIPTPRSGLAATALIATLAFASMPALAQPGGADDAPADPYAPTPAAPAAPAAPDGPADADAPPSGLDDDRQRELDDEVARALYERGKTLHDGGDDLNAKQLFIESLERSARGPSAGDALGMLRIANQRLGIANLDDGNPAVASTDPLDPYGTGGPGDDLLDPYGGDPALDPYAGRRDEVDEARTARRRITMWSAGFGALLGLAIAGPQNDAGETRGAAFLAALAGGGIGAGAAWYAVRKRRLTLGQGQAVISAGTWGAYTIALFGDAVTGVDTTTSNEGFKATAIGGALGLAGGALYASRVDPSEDEVAVVNSFGLYGTTAGLMVGVAMAPPETEAYSINGFIGAGAGLVLGHYLSKRLDVSRRRMLRVDLGALAGLAATWAVFYPLVADDQSDNDEQAAGLISIAAMAGGGYIGWRLTRGMDAPDKLVVGQDVPVAGLINRRSDGTWSVGSVVPRPMENPALAPRSGAFSLGADVLGGRF
jgi:hypothetical protein